ncbi:NADPH:quinone reductase-like Zn-dependent oxidoreductase [Nitrospirillum amazonense]|uniref:NADPH:quinone reductase-like Zn-dependent oxidoreductase n=1 Tax=Nitrospirillum amazonense TaxID=28077 RepID=A0A560KGL0_9PROT|nr:zinc-binding dehydrogenase [Nitrospirillum amazonense]TWB82367.1 NADPH:quinone reductase-like Zn-dependent oxidoreductase [Nitrospirillum amazonense]
MKAIVIKQYGGPEVLAIEERPDPVARAGHVLIEVKAFGLNHAEIYFRRGAWGEVAEISGIECAGLVRSDPSGQFRPGQTVVGLVGGMGRSLNGSYAELTLVPVSNVVAVETDLSWEDLAALPESYATAWSAIISILKLKRGQTLVIRGATSALGQAAVNIAADLGVLAIGTTRRYARAGLIEAAGAHAAMIEGPELSTTLRREHKDGVDAVLDIVGNSTVLDSLAMLKRDGEVCLIGFLGGGEPLSLQPVFNIPSGRRLSVFASALVLGGSEFPLSEVPFQSLIDKATSGAYRATPAHVFGFDDIREAHSLMESGDAKGKIVVSLG